VNYCNIALLLHGLQDKSRLIIAHKADTSGFSCNCKSAKCPQEMVKIQEAGPNNGRNVMSNKIMNLLMIDDCLLFIMMS